MAIEDGDILKVVSTIECPAAVVAQNVWYYQLSDPNAEDPTDAQIIGNLEDEISAMYNDILAHMNNEYQIEDILVSKIEWIDDKWTTTEDVGVGDISLTGGSAFDAAPHGVAATITGYTSRPQSRGRKFFTGIPEDKLTDSTLTGDLITALTALGVEYLSDVLFGTNMSMGSVIVSQSGPAAGTIFPLLLIAVNAIAGYQRRRKPGVGS